jgi:hypothetical protein
MPEPILFAETMTSKVVVLLAEEGHTRGNPDPLRLLL